MKSFFRKILRPPLIIVIILLAAAAPLACGPATQLPASEQPVSQPAQDKSTPCPTNTPEPTPLPTNIVRKTDDGDGWQEIMSVKNMPPKPTFKYPKIRHADFMMM